MSQNKKNEEPSKARSVFPDSVLKMSKPQAEKLVFAKESIASATLNALAKYGPYPEVREQVRSFIRRECPKLRAATISSQLYRAIVYRRIMQMKDPSAPKK